MVLIYKNRKQDEKEHLLEIQAFVSKVTVLELFIHVTIKISLTGRKTVSNTEKKWKLEYVPVFDIYAKILYITFT